MANPPVPAVIQPSPFALDDNFQPVSGQSDQMINYYVLPCDSSNNTCSSGANQYLSETLTLSQMIKENLETTVDTFETIKVPYDGVINDQNTDPNIRLDIRAFCGVANDTNISFSGSRWYYPKIGVVRYEMHCSSSSGDQQIAAATVSSVKFQY